MRRSRRTFGIAGAAASLACAAALASTALTAAGCSAKAEAARRAHLARTNLPGMSVADLKSCAGPPLRIEHAGNWDYLMYASELRPDQDRSTQCVATFMARKGYVEDLSYESSTGRIMGENIVECLDIVDPCLPAIPEDD